ncbi:MAG: DUF2961 domain-containing protein [Candidatus Hydrogenedentes bacterium]|nr:DUF2961 domain-containing protein [Candidatus Hydrogenedentota bacterium]
MSRVKVLFAFYFMLSLLNFTSFSNEVVTTGSLLKEMSDLNSLTYFPEPSYRLIQFSSYDRRSTQRLHKHWFENSDGFGHEPIPGFLKVLKAETKDEDGEYLLAEVKSPGAIVRTWTAQIKGKLKIYLDEATEPIFDGSAEEFFRFPYSYFLKGTSVGDEILRGSFYQRDSAYCPIPFSKSCRIVWIGKKKDLHFYHIMFRVYPDGTIVQTFNPEDLKKNEDLILRTAQSLKERNIYDIPNFQKVTFDNELPTKEDITVWQSNTGPGIVNVLKINVKDVNFESGRDIILRIYADDIKEPLVDSPLIDFFGSAPGLNPFLSIPLEVTPDGWLVSRFPMPYKEKMSIVLRNISDKVKRVSGEVYSAPYEWDDLKSMYFMARWRGEIGVSVKPSHPYDLPFLYAKGKGCLVGAVSHVFNPSTGPTSGGNWWGEGDEKIFVDDDSIPSIFGTGSEDFYNYSWSATDIFYYPYCGQPRNDGPGNRGFVSNYRWLFLDRVPFSKFVAFSIELLIHESTSDMGYARIAYYYARPETTDDHSPISDYEYNPLSVKPDWSWLPEPKGAAKNAIFYQAEDCVSNFENLGLISNYQWAGRGLCVWKPSKVGEKVSFKIYIPQEKEYEVKLVCGLSPNGGEFTVAIDDMDVKDGYSIRKLNLHDDHRTLSREISLGRYQLSKGDHTITLTSASESGKLVGIDFIWLQP